MPRRPHSMADRSTDLLKARARAASKHLPRALAGEEEPIHQMRVAGRRLRVALPLLARKPGAKRVRRSLRILRALTRAAGRSRDLDVSVALFEERLRALGTSTPELAALRRRLRAARSRSRARMAEDLLDIEISRLRQDLRAIVKRTGEALFAVLVRLRQARDVGGASLLSAFAALEDRFEPEALHRLRIRARRLRYVAEVNAALKDQPSEAPALLKELQERLGRIHDAHVTALWFRRQAESAEKAGRTDLAAVARNEEAFFLEGSREHHRALLERNPDALVRQALEAMGQARPAA